MSWLSKKEIKLERMEVCGCVFLFRKENRRIFNLFTFCEFILQSGAN